MYERIYYKLIKERIEEPRKFIQVVTGPRQVGKTAVVKQVLKTLKTPWLMFSADEVPSAQREWIANCWESARAKLRAEQVESVVLVIDEVQKIKGWSEVVKKMRDEDSFHDTPVKLILLGSSRVLQERDMADSLMGRFETIKIPHWSFFEMEEAFNFSLEQYIYYGGYPGAAELIGDESRWAEYIRSAIIDATINKDVLADAVVNKPALLRQTFELAAAYSGEIVSLTKMIGQLQDAGNTTTLSSYLQLLQDSGLVCGLQKYSPDGLRRRASIPKYQVYNNALKSIYCGATLHEAMKDHKLWGRLFESAVGCHIINTAFTSGIHPYYWRDGNDEVDYVMRNGSKVVGIEVKSNMERYNKGLARFREQFNPTSAFVVGYEGYPVVDFLTADLRDFLKLTHDARQPGV